MSHDLIMTLIGYGILAAAAMPVLAAACVMVGANLRERGDAQGRAHPASTMAPVRSVPRQAQPFQVMERMPSGRIRVTPLPMPARPDPRLG